jgi:hypothetical protein
MKRILFVGFLFSIGMMLAFGQDTMSIGKIGEEGELVYPSQAEEGPDGNIYVYDAVDAYIKVYSQEGKYLRKMGGEGQGPGEIKRAEGVRFGFTLEGLLYFTEFINGHRWITLMELSGKLKKTLKLQISEMFGISSSYPLEDGGFLLQLSFYSIPEAKDDYFFYKSPRELVRINAEGKIVSRLKKTLHVSRISYQSDGADAPVPFTPQFMWCPYVEGKVLFTDGLSSVFQVYDYEGNQLEEMATPLPAPEKVTKKDLDEWKTEWKQRVNKDWYRRFGTVIDKYKKSIHEKKPNLSGLSLTPAGNILVAGTGDEGGDYLDYWLLDKKGKRLIRGKTSSAGLHITPHFLLYGRRNEDGSFQFYAQKRTGSEEQDLKKFFE